jgi:orotate phosphoribosyltransferase
MISEILRALPVRRGHFLLESGYHTDQWRTLDAMFVNPQALVPLVDALADRLRPYDVEAVCGPLLGGAFLAHALATALGINFYFSEPIATAAPGRVFAAQYRLRPEFHRHLGGERVALVDDVVSAGSSVRATATALSGAGASTIVVGTVLLLGTVALDHFAHVEIPIEALEREDLTLWQPAMCPLCRNGVPLEATTEGR